MTTPSGETSNPCGDFLPGYQKITVKRAGILTGPYPCFGAHLEVEKDLSPLFPLVNGNVSGAQYLDSPERVQFLFEGIRCTIYPGEIIAAGFNDPDHAKAFAENLRQLLNRLFASKASLKPDYRKAKRLATLDLYKILPHTNCGECGFPSCLAFAGALSQGSANISQCPGAARPIEEYAVYPVVDREGRLTRTIVLDLPTEGDSRRQPPSELAALLTEREVEVLKHIALGATNTEIAERLFISPHTVKTHVVHIYAKLGVNDRTQAAVIAARHRLI